MIIINEKVMISDTWPGGSKNLELTLVWNVLHQRKFTPENLLSNIKVLYMKVNLGIRYVIISKSGLN